MEGTGDGERYRFYGHLPAVCHNQGKLGNEGEQTQKCPQAA